MNLNRPFDSLIVSNLYVRVTTANVSKHDTVFVFQDIK